jgi:FkbM family methyltransferase
MLLREIPYLNRLPKSLKKLVVKYSIKKILGFVYTNSEKEANIALRILSMAKGEILNVDATGITWNINISETSIVVRTRRYPSSDMGILFQVLGKVEYEPAVNILRKLKSRNDNIRIIDAGANVGLASMYFKACFPKAEIISLEIDDNNFIQIEKNLSLNQYTSIYPIKKALWKRTANLEIKRDFRDQSECSFYVEESAEQTYLQGANLSSYMKDMNWDFVDLLKIDIEGAEQYLFENESLADELLSKTNLLAIEIHDEFEIRLLIYKHLKRNGFQHFKHGDLTIAFRDIK